jgi:hypothetical protein
MSSDQTAALLGRFDELWREQPIRQQLLALL